MRTVAKIVPMRHDHVSHAGQPDIHAYLVDMVLKKFFAAGSGNEPGGFTRPDRRTYERGLFVAAGLVLAAAAIVTWMNLDRSRGFLQNLLAEKGKMLLLALESGVRTGSRTYGGLRFQYFLEELASREDVRFIAVVMPDGTIVAHTNPERVGEILVGEAGEMSPEQLAAFTEGQSAGWTLAPMEGGPAFIVYAAFVPQKRSDTISERRPTAESPYIFLGLSTFPLEQGRMMDHRRAMMYGGGVLIFGLLLVVCVYALARVRVSGRGQREAEALVDELALHLPDGLLLLDTRGRVVSMNQSAQHLLMPPETETQGVEGIKALLPEALLGLVNQLVRESTLHDTELRLERNGRPLYLSVRGGHVGEGDTRIGSLMLLRDMSEVRQLEAEVRRREKLAAVGNLAAGVAHELRNPLSSIKGYATYFSERFPEGSDEREAAKIMVRETDRLNRSVTDLIGLARPTGIRVTPTNLARLLEDAVRLIRQDAEARNVDLVLECADEVPPVPVDPDRVRQVLLNLCLNALDAMPDGGRLTLRLFADPQNAEQVVMELADTGVGITAEHLAHIFDPYFTTKGHGTGLGLATVHKIMEAHGGSVAVSSTPGCGTAFRLCFHIDFAVQSGGIPA